MLPLTTVSTQSVSLKVLTNEHLRTDPSRVLYMLKCWHESEDMHCPNVKFADIARISRMIDTYGRHNIYPDLTSNERASAQAYFTHHNVLLRRLFEQNPHLLLMPQANVWWREDGL